MKKCITILFLALTTILHGTIYYVAPTGGSDSNAGTNINAPWATFQKAISVAIAGDTVYFRNGIWYPTASISISPREGSGHNGLPGNPICYFAYPGERAIFDFKNAVAPPANPNGDGNRYLTGLGINDAHWINLRDLTVRNVYQRVEYVHAIGISGFPQSNCTYENIQVYNISGEGYYSESDVGYIPGYTYGWDDVNLGYVPYDTTRYINCDTYRCTDSLRANLGNEPGNMGDGFKHINGGGVVYFNNCRAWLCSDDGFDMPGFGKHYFTNCWAFSNGLNANTGLPVATYEGNGFKVGANDIENNVPKRIFNNCLAAYNTGSGLYILEYAGYVRSRTRAYNITLYKNQTGISISDNPAWENSDIILRNVLSVLPTGIDAGSRPNIIDAQSIYTISNSNFIYALLGSTPRWDYNPNITVSDADFMKTSYAECMSQLTARRKRNGSLPDISFLNLRSTSSLIDAGIKVPSSDNSAVILKYNNAAPDIGALEYNPIIADHTVVDKYDDIPQYWIDEVKKMWVSYAGESHSEGIRAGLQLLENQDAKYAVSIRESGTPEAYTTSHLRASRATWGDVDYLSGWIYGYGEEDWFTSSTAINRTKAGITYANHNGFDLSAFGFGWCWDPGVDFTDYINATISYMKYCADSIYTKVFFTTGTVDSYTDESGYIKHLGYEQIRDSVRKDNRRVLFDYADILCYNNGASTPNTDTWNGHTYPIITSTNLSPTVESYHISEAGALRLGKAMWWMLARIAGWDGLAVNTTNTDILSFSIPNQILPAVINTVNHTVLVTMPYGTNRASLTPTISIADGAAISPTSGTARNFTTSQTYSVIAADGVTTQSWTVNVVVATVSTATDITSFAVSGQVGSSTINTGAHTIALTMPYGTSVTVLTPTIGVSSGATVIPLSGVARDFTNPVPYTVTAEDGVTYQEWTVTVTQEAEPVIPVPTGGAIVKFNGKIVKR